MRVITAGTCEESPHRHNRRRFHDELNHPELLAQCTPLAPWNPSDATPPQLAQTVTNRGHFLLEQSSTNQATVRKDLHESAANVACSVMWLENTDALERGSPNAYELVLAWPRRRRMNPVRLPYSHQNLSAPPRKKTPMS